MNTIEVFVRGDAHTPARFWDYALRTEYKFGRELHEMGFHYSETDTEEYKKLSDEDKKKVQFLYVNSKRMFK